VNVRALLERDPDHPALARYAEAGRILCGEAFAEDAEARGALVHRLEDWTRKLHLPTLDQFGVTRADYPRIVAHSRGSSMKTNPIELTDAEIEAILGSRQGSEATE
jgi:alcohol dehydrogenase